MHLFLGFFLVAVLPLSHLWAYGRDLYEVDVKKGGAAWGKVMHFRTELLGLTALDGSECEDYPCISQSCSQEDSELCFPTKLSLTDENFSRAIFLVQLYPHLEMKGSPMEELLVIVDRDSENGVGSFRIQSN